MNFQLRKTDSDRNSRSNSGSKFGSNTGSKSGSKFGSNSRSVSVSNTRSVSVSNTSSISVSVPISNPKPTSNSNSSSVPNPNSVPNSRPRLPNDRQKILSNNDCKIDLNDRQAVFETSHSEKTTNEEKIVKKGKNIFQIINSTVDKNHENYFFANSSRSINVEQMYNVRDICDSYIKSFDDLFENNSSENLNPDVIQQKYLQMMNLCQSLPQTIRDQQIIFTEQKYELAHNILSSSTAFVTNLGDNPDIYIIVALDKCTCVCHNKNKYFFFYNALKSLIESTNKNYTSLIIPDYFVKHIRNQNHKLFDFYSKRYNITYWQLAWISNIYCIDENYLNGSQIQKTVCYNGTDCQIYDPEHLVTKYHY